MAGWNIEIDGSTVIDVGTTKPKTFTGLSPGMHSFRLQRYDDFGTLSLWTDPITAFLEDAVAIQLDSGRVAGGVISGYDQDQFFSSGSVGTVDWADTVSLSGVTNPAPASAYPTARIWSGGPPIYTLGSSEGLDPNTTYLVRYHANMGDGAYVEGSGLGQVEINGVITLHRFATAYDNPYIDIKTRAGGLHKALVLEYMGTTDGSGGLQIKINGSLNGNASGVAISALQVLIAPPVPSFTHSSPSNQLTAVTFTDTSLGNPSEWLWDFGDGTTSILQNPVHAFAAGTYEVTFIATNWHGDSEPYSATVTIPSQTAITLGPTTLPNAAQSTPYSQTLSGSSGTAPYRFQIVDEGTDALDFVDLGGNHSETRRRGALPAGLTLSSAGVLSGTPSVPLPGLVVIDGDSRQNGWITSPALYNADYSPSAQLCKMLPRGWLVVNRATGGETLVQIDSEYAAEVQPYLTDGKDYIKKVFIVDGGTNDVNGVLSTLAQMETAMQSVVSKGHADGARVVSCNMTIFWNYAGADLTKANSYNTWHASGSLVNTDAKVDWNSNPRLVNHHHNMFYRDGGIHETKLGYLEKVSGTNMMYDKVIAVSNTGTGATDAIYKFAVKVIDANGNAEVRQYTLTVTP